MTQNWKSVSLSVFILFGGWLKGIISLLDNSQTVYISNEIQMSRIGFGTAGLGQLTKEMTCEAITAGVRLIDSAQAREWYREDSVGKAIQECYNEQYQSHLVVVTKIHPRSYLPKTMKESLIKSQMDLYGRNRKLDVALLHAPFCWRGHCTPQQEAYNWLHAWKNLEDLHHEGYVSAIGASNLDSHQLHELLKIANSRVSVIQNWMDPFRQDQEVRSICNQYGIVYMAYSSLGGQWNYIQSVETNPVMNNPVLVSIAKKYNSTVTSIVLSWVLQEGAIIIPRSGNKKNIKSNAELLMNRISLDEYDLKLIHDLDGTLGVY